MREIDDRLVLAAIIKRNQRPKRSSVAGDEVTRSAIAPVSTQRFNQKRTFSALQPRFHKLCHVLRVPGPRRQELGPGIDQAQNGTGPDEVLGHTRQPTPNQDDLTAKQQVYAVSLDQISSVGEIGGCECLGDGFGDTSKFWGFVEYQFLGGSLGCVDAADVDDNGQSEITDAIYLLTFLFLGGPAPDEPFPTCGPDATTDELACEILPPCGRS